MDEEKYQSHYINDMGKDPYAYSMACLAKDIFRFHSVIG